MDGPIGTPWHAKPAAEVLTQLKTTEEGLSDAEASMRLKEFGKNELRQKKARTIWQMLRGQLTDVMVLILIGASVLSICLNEISEGLVILFIVVVNAAIGIFQEKKAQSSLEALRDMSAPHARVLRQGEESEIPANELVPGDIVLLQDGVRVPADIRLLESSSLRIEESALTGESVPAEKDSEEELAESCSLGDRFNMAYASTIVLYGRGIGVVVATGMKTEVGNIAELLEDEDDFDTPLKRKLNAVGKSLTVVGLIICVVIFSVGFLIYGRNWLEMLMMAISLAISIIPEGLPATATIVMAIGVQRMAKRNALILRLPAVETLGSATVICCDKTGTLTQNRMTVSQLALIGDCERGTAMPLEEAKKNDVYREIVLAGALCNDAAFDPDSPGNILGDPTEGALLFLADAFGMDQEKLEEQYPREFEQVFDSVRKRMTTVQCIDGSVVAYAKGAVETMLPICTQISTPDGLRAITDKDRRAIIGLADRLAGDALRVLGFAKRILKEIPDDDEADVEHEMTFIGMAAMFDPPRKEVAAAVKTCMEAGIRTVMITGDNRITAMAIARQLGIWQEGDVAMTGEELDSLSSKELEKSISRRNSVFARVSPRDKLRIVRALKKNGEITAMTGDGVNDAPALKASDIGAAMGKTGTDVAKDAADMVLLDDNFTTIVHAVEEGRRVYRTIQKVIQFLLAGNVGEIITLLVATILNWNAPVLAIHILWVNLVTDTLPALALGVDPAAPDIMKQQPVRSGSLFEPALVTRVIIHGILIAAATILAYHLGLASGGHRTGQTMAFCVLAFSQLLHAFNQRSNVNSAFCRSTFLNPWLFGSIALAFALMLALLTVPALSEVFKLAPLSRDNWQVAIALSFLPLAGVELLKLIKRNSKIKFFSFL